MHVSHWVHWRKLWRYTNITIIVDHFIYDKQIKWSKLNDEGRLYYLRKRKRNYFTVKVKKPWPFDFIFTFELRGYRLDKSETTRKSNKLQFSVRYCHWKSCTGSVNKGCICFFNCSRNDAPMHVSLQKYLLTLAFLYWSNPLKQGRNKNKIKILCFFIRVNIDSVLNNLIRATHRNICKFK